MQPTKIITLDPMETEGVFPRMMKMFEIGPNQRQQHMFSVDHVLLRIPGSGSTVQVADAFHLRDVAVITQGLIEALAAFQLTSVASAFGILGERYHWVRLVEYAENLGEANVPFARQNTAILRHGLIQAIHIGMGSSNINDATLALDLVALGTINGIILGKSRPHLTSDHTVLLRTLVRAKFQYAPTDGANAFHRRFMFQTLPTEPTPFQVAAYLHATLKGYA
jgi:hypothetical protein